MSRGNLLFTMIVVGATLVSINAVIMTKLEVPRVLISVCGGMMGLSLALIYNAIKVSIFGKED